jgi:TolB-like protein/Tfp pilus assembly protein PilF
MASALGFGPFCLDERTRALHRDGAPVPLGQRAAALLLVLLERRDQIVSKDDLLQAAWPDQVMAESNLTVQIATLRNALGEDEHGQQWIATVARRGYRFAGMVREIASAENRVLAPPSDRPSIAVLPFDNMGGNPGHAYFSDGITHDIISALSKFAGLMVIGADSSFRYRGVGADLPRLARDLGVRYVLEGGVRRGERQIRIGTRLVDTATGVHLWAETYERPFRDLFALQDEITEQITGRLIAHVSRAEQERARRKPPHSQQAYDYYLRAIDLARTFDNASYQVSRQLLERAIAADPHFAPAYPELAMTHVRAWSEPRDADFLNPATLLLADATVRRGLDLDPDLATGHATLGSIRFWQGQHDRAVTEIEWAIRLNPNWADYRYGYVLIYAGHGEKALVVLQRAMRLNPFFPGFWLGSVGHAYLTLRRYAEALGPLREAVARAPRYWPGFGWLAATCAQLGLTEDAEDAVAAIRGIEPAITIATWERMISYRNKADLLHMLDGLRKAGMAE